MYHNYQIHVTDWEWLKEEIMPTRDTMKEAGLMLGKGQDRTEKSKTSRQPYWSQLASPLPTAPISTLCNSEPSVYLQSPNAAKWSGQFYFRRHLFPRSDVWLFLCLWDVQKWDKQFAYLFPPWLKSYIMYRCSQRLYEWYFVLIIFRKN